MLCDPLKELSHFSKVRSWNAVLKEVCVYKLRIQEAYAESDMFRFTKPLIFVMFLFTNSILHH